MRNAKSLLLKSMALFTVAVALGACGTDTPEETATVSPEPTGIIDPSPEPTQPAPPTAKPVVQTPEPDIEVTAERPGVELTEETEATTTPQPTGPTAVIVSGDSAALGQPFTFNATQSIEDEHPIVGYEWDMGDGTYLFGLSIQHGYAEAGIYTVTLTVTDQGGNKGRTSKVIEITEIGTATPEYENFLLGTSWEMDNAVRNTTVTLVFDVDFLSGSAGCNTYNAPYTFSATGDSSANISVSLISVTGDDCTQEIMGQERGYLESLASAGAVTVEGQSLTMQTIGGIMTFTLVGTGG
jgi:heat shock protein HslJ